MEWLYYSLGVVAGISLIWLLLRGRKFYRVMCLSRIKESYQLQAIKIQNEFLDKARETGKPRGLHWKDIQFEATPTFIQDQQSKQFLALLGCVVEFEAISGEEMEDNPNVDLPKEGTAVFEFEKGHWVTHGRVLFNMNPKESLHLLGSKYVVVM